MSRTTLKKILSNPNNSIGKSQESFISNKNLEEKSSIKKEQLQIKINMSPMLNNNEPSYPFSQSISFRLKPIISTSISQEIKDTNLKSEIYSNPKLEKKISEFKPKLHVDLSHWHLIDQDISIIVKQIIIDKKCTELWLYGNKITSEGASILASSLKNNLTLKSLDISFNHISDIGIYSLTQVLLPSQNSFLKILYLSRNDISDNGVKYLSEMLKTNHTLTELWLSNNEISNQGVKQLANVLAYYNKTLKFLSLSMNRSIIDLSIDYLIEMFEHNQTLRTFWMTDCSLTESGKTKLRDKTNKKKKLKIEV